MTKPIPPSIQRSIQLPAFKARGIKEPSGEMYVCASDINIWLTSVAETLDANPDFQSDPIKLVRTLRDMIGQAVERL